MQIENNLIICDNEFQQMPKSDDTLLWNSYKSSEINNIFSMMELVESNSDKLRLQYLNFIYELGETEINEKRVVNHLNLRPRFSYWWMTLLVEKCNYSKSPQIDNVIKSMALKDWLIKKNYTKISLFTSNIILAESLQLLSFELELDIDISIWKEQKEPNINKILKRIYKKLPYIVQSPLWLIKYLISRWPLKGVGVKQWRESKGKITFVSYLFNLSSDLSNKGSFSSNYWGCLPSLLEQQAIKSNCLHNYLESDSLPNATAAKNQINLFNNLRDSNQVHVTLDSFLSIRLVSSVIIDWYKLIKSSKLLEISLKKKAGAFWPFLKKDYVISMKGPAAISNLLFLNLFEEAMDLVKKQEKGFYLQENQAWEMGFIHAWKSAGHDSYLVGCPHATVRYWDLRYFFSHKSYERRDDYDLPLPSYIGVNGIVAKKMYIKGGYPEVCLVEVEALRYLYLLDRSNKPNETDQYKERSFKILVLADYSKKFTNEQMDLISQALPFINGKIQLIVKPHPGFSILKENYPHLDIVITNEGVSSLVENYSLAYTSNTTSAALDAYCAGKIVITAMSQQGLNLSPLRGNKDVYFVSNPKELAILINDFNQIQEVAIQRQDYFYLDFGLPKWKKLLIKKNDIISEN